MSKVIYYAVKGMIASETNAIEVLANRLSVIAEHRPEICESIIDGIAVGVRIIDMNGLKKMLNKESIKNVSCYPVMGGDLSQSINVEYDDEKDVHRCASYPLPLDIHPYNQVFEVTYMQHLLRVGGVGYQLTSSSLFPCVTKQNALINRRASPGCYSALLPTVVHRRDKHMLERKSSHLAFSKCFTLTTSTTGY